VDSENEYLDEDGSEISVDGPSEEFVSPDYETSDKFISDDNDDMRSETFSPVLATSNYKLGLTFVFLNNLLDDFTWEYVYYYADKIIFKPDILERFNIYTTIKLDPEQIYWDVRTNCTENYTIWGDRIIRKIKYNHY